MLDKIIAFSIRNKPVIAMLTVALVAAGVWSAARLPIDVIPDISNNQVQVITLSPSLGAQEVEQFITAPIELATGNIPDMTEKRSISRSGLSVITLVFKDKTDIYWARQQVLAQLKEVESQIPKGLGKPVLAPITTGLGEIYHYVIHAEPGYEDQFSATDLRTIQDWIVKRELAGVEGLAEVSGWGGFVKQYEIALDNERLNAMDVTIAEIYQALEKNNENTGGSYIEQQSSAYFIRGLGQVKTLDDIERIVIKNTNGNPVLVRDVATVQFGNSTRYGAVTRNGEGEVVAGMTLMLKGENFNEVSKNVRERMAQIQKTLPEGVVIEPFIDRSELVGRAIGTVEKNLLEGGLIVIFILVLLLGNLRAGLVVASVIPLAMLFALCLMRLFGVSGNLMSLGAIDFGLIVDGAVIIVEAIVHRISVNQKLQPGAQALTQPQMDAEVYGAATKIRNSAAFGEIIIMIVYLPILFLAGIEGKMFIPMAQTVAFAILGAFILSLTYIPMMSALFLSKKAKQHRNISDRIIAALQRIYSPVLHFTLRFKRTFVAAFAILFALSIWIFSSIGGEFIPTLEEGDLTVEISGMQGTSLTQTVETFTKAEKILRMNFPEIRQVVTRIGSAEIPTDPMPIERGDMMLQMIPKEDWKNAATREEMQEKIEKALSVIPGINVEVTQPMQMRFNELMTGIRQDVAVKIYGDDLDELARQANVVGGIIAPVKGVTEPTIEKATGLPQIVIEYNRDKMAQYGVSISDVNMILSTAFAGNVAGVVFEGEKRFAMVVRLKRELREDLQNIEHLYIPLPSGSKVPLNQIADIKVVEAPAQVSRENGKRRVYVGFNVRGRDVESVVEEIQENLAKVKLPPGYTITYGGQFENLKAANARLMVSVPLALGLILVLLYFTFHSVKQALLIFTAIPLSAIGGILALWARDMPFSISAGVGFIALFGVAVLNGIVLIGEFNALEKEGLTDIYERVKVGTKNRLRPVIMTASVAALGFFPMAFSTSAGAEVQKPLASVVIGGLLSATLLTLLVLPALYILFSGTAKIQVRKTASTIMLLLLPVLSFAQPSPSKSLTVEEAVTMALGKNPQLKSASLEVEQQKALTKTAFDFPRTNLTLMHGQYNSSHQDNNFGITQDFSFPTVYGRQAKVQQQQVILSEKALASTREELIRNVKSAYYQLVSGKEKLKLLQTQDSIYSRFADVAQVKYKTGETSNLEKLSAISKYEEVRLLKRQAEADIIIYQNTLQKLLGNDQEILVADSKLQRLPLIVANDSAAIRKNPMLAYYSQKISLATSQLSLEKNKFLPDLSIGYFNQSLDGISGFQGVQVGIGIPIFFSAQQARVQSAKIKQDIARNDALEFENSLRAFFNQQLQENKKYSELLDYYETTGLNQAQQILRITQFSYKKGEIGYVEYIQNLTQALAIRSGYLDALNQYNQTVININFLTGGN
ncbi:CusA/CzcA family heavy metal efflux RND transporter [Flavobacterium magnum]|uniref:CusA/CzcA family heavy metal efflux RND transporter n=1 Tax=Flavobacterium magnum TaxID=2162713 RepID=A0A2S0RCJ1_9FLAO|nr:CusA/CzcA family heavy metal efflux RND transporter [Flavobacterium magnum]AWA28978.1 CusA/CzcA family heavy metal efflux RND transporter [Flavobacterium magnum]